MRNYEVVKKQWETLWAVAEAKDMTGGYVDQQDLHELLMSPSKITAKKCLERQIRYWFQVGPDSDQYRTAAEAIDDMPKIRFIAEDYGYA